MNTKFPKSGAQPAIPPKSCVPSEIIQPTSGFHHHIQKALPQSGQQAVATILAMVICLTIGVCFSSVFFRRAVSEHKPIDANIEKFRDQEGKLNFGVDTEKIKPPEKR